MKTRISLTVFLFIFSAAVQGGEQSLPAALIDNVSAASAALAKDDLAAYRSAVPGIVKGTELTTGVTKAVLTPLAVQLQSGQDIAVARAHYKLFSHTIANIVAAQKTRQAKVFECPHAGKIDDVTVPLRWIQKDPQIANPFWGSKMLRCGKEVQSKD